MYSPAENVSSVSESARLAYWSAWLLLFEELPFIFEVEVSWFPGIADFGTSKQVAPGLGVGVSFFFSWDWMTRVLFFFHTMVRYFLPGLLGRLACFESVLSRLLFTSSSCSPTSSSVSFPTSLASWVAKLIDSAAMLLGI